MSYDIEVVNLPEQPAAVVRARVAHNGIAEFLGPAFGDVMTVLQRQGLQPAGPPFGRYRPADDGGWDISAGFPVSDAVAAEGRVEALTLPGGPVARTLHVGDYGAPGERPTRRCRRGWLTTGTPLRASRGSATSTSPRWCPRAPRSASPAGRGAARAHSTRAESRRVRRPLAGARAVHPPGTTPSPLAAQWWKLLGRSSTGIGDSRWSSQSIELRRSRRNSSAMSWLKPLRTTTRSTTRSSRLGGIV